MRHALRRGSGEVLISVHAAAVNPVSAPRQSFISTTDESKRMVLLTPPKNPIRMEICAQVIDKDIVSSSTLAVTGSTTPPIPRIGPCDSPSRVALGAVCSENVDGACG